MNIDQTDKKLLLAFLEREAEDFRYVEERIDGNKGRRRRIKQVVKSYFSDLLEKIKDLPGGDYLVIQSITNLGLVERELKLTLSPSISGTDYICFLPPLPPPRGSINIVEKKKYGQRQ